MKRLTSNQIVALVKRELDARYPDITPANIDEVLLFVQRRCFEISEAPGGAR